MPEFLPVYATGPLRRFLDYYEESLRLLHLSMRGISGLRGMPGLLKLVPPWSQTVTMRDLAESVSDEKTKKAKRDLETAEARANFAEKESESGFPILHAHTLVGLWGGVEAAVEDMLVGILLNEPGVLESEAFCRVKVQLAEFHRLDAEERMRLLLAEIERHHGSATKLGVDAFEFVLEKFGLSGPVEPEIKKLLWEMHHVRNVLVHRAGLADRRLVENCPWLNLKQGNLVRVNHSSLMQFGGALCKYVLGLAYRLGTRYDVDIDALIAAYTDTHAKTVSSCEDF